MVLSFLGRAYTLLENEQPFMNIWVAILTDSCSGATQLDTEVLPTGIFMLQVLGVHGVTCSC